MGVVGEDVPEREALAGRGRHGDCRRADGRPAIEVVRAWRGPGRRAGHERVAARRGVSSLLCALEERGRGPGAYEASRYGRGVGAVRVYGPAPGHLEVVIERPAPLLPDGRAQHGQRTPGTLEEVENRLLVPTGLARDERIVRVGPDRQLEGVREDPVQAVLVVAGRAGADVQVARLFRLVAVGRGHPPADEGERLVVGHGHVVRDVGEGVSVWPHNEATGLV